VNQETKSSMFFSRGKEEKKGKSQGKPYQDPPGSVNNKMNVVRGKKKRKKKT